MNVNITLFMEKPINQNSSGTESGKPGIQIIKQLNAT
jgi:hypothetical protein